MESPRTSSASPDHLPRPSIGAATRRGYRVYSEDDRALFFESLARLGGIAASARELGFNRATCTMWAEDASRQAGTKYSPEQKTEFLAVLDRTSNVAQTAKKLGINVQTAFHWAYSTGAVERTPRRNLTARQLALQPQKAEFLVTSRGVVEFASTPCGSVI